MSETLLLVCGAACTGYFAWELACLMRRATRAEQASARRVPSDDRLVVRRDRRLEMRRSGDPQVPGIPRSVLERYFPESEDEARYGRCF